MLILPEERRHFFKDPFGELYPGIAPALPLLARRTVYAVGDVVTHNLQKNGVAPDVSVIDGHTMRSPCTQAPPCHGRIIRVKNPPGTITDELVAGIDDAIAHPPATVYVSGEEDLAVVPLVLAAPEGVVVLYGQPHRGVVVRTVDAKAKEAARELLSHFIRSDTV
ncbi:MAG: GTP-dependent dephospho-CoA kinase family protein [Methanoregula sp.]|nr:MAG: GTP-dependent dephospho-CoA kinase family protein [Methanoregula sp.]